MLEVILLKNKGKGKALMLGVKLSVLQIKSNRGKVMKQLIELYIMKLETGHITYKQMELYDEVIELYMNKMKKRLED
jgi:hypothetical protein